MPLQDYGRYMAGSAEMAAAPANALLGAYYNAQQNARRNADTNIAQQRTDIQWQQAQQDRATQQQAAQTEQQKAADIEQARALLAAGRSGNPAARAYAVKFVIGKAPPEVQASMAQADPEALWKNIEPALAQAVGEKPQGAGQLYQTAEGFLPAEQAVGKMPYQPPQRAPISGPTSDMQNFRFRASLTPAQQAEWDKMNAKGANGSKPLPTSALKIVDEAKQALAATAQSDALVTDAITSLQQGKVSLGFISNAEARAKNYAGISDANSRAYASLKQTIEKLRNNYLLLAKGVQTEGDATRAWNSEIGESVQNDNALALQQLQKAQQMIRMQAQAQQSRIDNIYSNFGAESPQDASAPVAPPVTPAPANQAPPQAIEHLRQHPELKAAFKAKYGYIPDGI